MIHRFVRWDYVAGYMVINYEVLFSGFVFLSIMAYLALTWV